MYICIYLITILHIIIYTLRNGAREQAARAVNE